MVCARATEFSRTPVLSNHHIVEPLLLTFLNRSDLGTLFLICLTERLCLLVQDSQLPRRGQQRIRRSGGSPRRPENRTEGSACSTAIASHELESLGPSQNVVRAEASYKKVTAQ